MEREWFLQSFPPMRRLSDRRLYSEKPEKVQIFFFYRVLRHLKVALGQVGAVGFYDSRERGAHMVILVKGAVGVMDFK